MTLNQLCTFGNLLAIFTLTTGCNVDFASWALIVAMDKNHITKEATITTILSHNFKNNKFAIRVF
jgi:hypothetical protein